MKIKVFMITILISVILSGCQSKVSTTENQDNIIAEYSAGLLLKYDKNYSDKLIYNMNDVKETKIVADSNTGAGLEINASLIKDKEPIIDKNITEDTKTNIVVSSDKESLIYKNIAEVYNQDGFDISYSKYSMEDSYPNDELKSYFNLQASKNNQLIIVNFNIKNISSKKRKINLLNSEINYNLTINDNKTYKPLMTLLINDLQYIDLDIQANKVETAVIVFEVPKNIQIRNGNIVITNGSKKGSINIK